MSENSKTTMEIFNEKYPLEEVKGNPILIAEAIGYLKATKEYIPSLEKKIENTRTLFLLLMLQNLR